MMFNKKPYKRFLFCGNFKEIEKYKNSLKTIFFNLALGLLEIFVLAH